MTSQRKKKWWRPRFSIRTLAILIILICGYAACWGPTKSRGVQDVGDHYWSHEGPQPFSLSVTTHPVLPFILSQEYQEIEWGAGDADVPVGIDSLQPKTRTYRRYYFWFFGYVAQLHEREVKAEAWRHNHTDHDHTHADPHGGQHGSALSDSYKSL